MILESGIKFRDFSEQPAFSFNLDLSLSSSSGNSSFGISGSNGGYDLFKFNNGRVFDPLNRFVYSYSKSDAVSLSGNFRSGVFGYYINNNPIALNVNVCNPSYTFKNIYLSTKDSTMDFNVNMYGYKVPSYDFAFSNTSFLTGNSITGAILNTSNDSWSSFKVFSGNASFSYSGYKFQSVPASSEIPHGQSGLFSFNYSGAGSEYTISASTGVEPLSYNINLYTNFGLVNKTGLLNLRYSPFYFIDFYRYSTGYINNTYSWGYYLDGITCNQLPFTFKLEKVSGFNYTNTTTGNLNFTGSATGNISNYIYGTGFLNGLVTSQYLASDQYDYYGNLLTFTGFTGIHSGDLIYKSGFIDANVYSFRQSVSGSVFGSGYIGDITTKVYDSVSQDALTHNFYSWSGSSRSGILTGITGSKTIGETYEYFVPGNFYVTGLGPNDLSVPAVYRQTGYLSSSTFSGVINDGKYKSSLKFGTVNITPSSGSAIIDNIKINTITGLKKASASFKLINGFDNYLTDSVDRLIFNTGSFNSLNQDIYSFYYVRALYNPLSSNQFSGAQDLVNKINTYHSNWLSGDYNQADRVLTFSSPSSIGHSGNYMYLQPVIKSGIDKFLDPSFNFSTSGFYFTGGATHFLNMNTGISGFHSGEFMVGISNPDVYFHKTEYGSFLNNFSPTVSNKSYVSHFFTGYTGVIYSGYNSYSNPYYATGNVDYVYNVNLTGLASGYNSSTNSSGIVKAIINKTGLISSLAVSGFASWKDFAITGTGSLGNVYVIPSGGTSYTEISKYWYGNFTGAFNFQAVKSGFYSLSTGIPVSAYTGASWVDYECRFDRNFNIKTGAFSNNGSILYSGVGVYYDSGNNVYTGSGVLNSTSCLPFNVSPTQYVNFEIAHYNPYNSGNNVMKYTISGITGSYLFTGLITE